MEKKETTIRAIASPEDYLYDYCCGNCIYMNFRETNNYDEAWCEKRSKYYRPSEVATFCNYYIQRRH